MPPSTPLWWKRRTPLAYFLLPLSWLYHACHKINQALTRSYESSLPVICIGGVVAGGSGKTPILHAVARLIETEGLFERPVILTRGYGGKYAGPTRVDPEIHTARDVGDEALLHAAILPTVVAKDRAAGARLAEAMGADVILLDDGLQNASLRKSVSFLVMDGAYMDGNGFLFPAGPLRETVKEAEAKCDAMIVTNAPDVAESSLRTLHANIEIASRHNLSRAYHAFCGLGRPEKFRMTLLKHGFNLSGFTAFPDHHPYTAANMELLSAKAGGDRLITTAKDFVKIPPAYRDAVVVLEIFYTFENPYAIASLIRDKARR